MELSLLAVILGFILDLIVGDPHWLYHPIRLVGHLISGLEKLLRSIFPKTEQGELIAGGFLLVLTAGITTAVAWGLLLAAGLVHPYLRFALEVMCYWVLATKSLKTETMKVYDALKEGDLKKARFAVSMVVGRDTEVLDDIGVTKAAVETVAENASDGVIAPLLFLMIGGAPLGFFYKAVNTMDSMVGYKNDKYLYFGRTAARIDDVLNFIPARITGLLLIVVAFYSKLNAKGALKMMMRDAKKHPSPNGGYAEAPVAGALHIRLGGYNQYFKKMTFREYMGDPIEKLNRNHITRTIYMKFFMGMLLYGSVKYSLSQFCH